MGAVAVAFIDVAAVFKADSLGADLASESSRFLSRVVFVDGSDASALRADYFISLVV